MAINGVSTHIRISGLASGLDTDRIISDLMKAERIPLDKIMQRKQLLTWKRDDYRSVISALSDFNKMFMDAANSATNMRSQTQYKKFAVSVTNNIGSVSNNVSAVGTTSAAAGAHKIVVKSLAASAKETSGSSVSAPLQTGDIRGDLALAGKTIKVTLDGVTRDISFDSDFTINDQASGDAFASKLQSLITDAFGKGLNDDPKVLASYDEASGEMTFQTAAGANKIALFSATANDGLGLLGISSGTSNRINTSSTLASLKDSFNGGLTFYDDEGTQKIKFTINNKEFTFAANTTLDTVMNTVSNDSDAKVNLSYDTITDKFIISSKQTGAGQNIQITNTWGNFFGADSATSIDPQAEKFGSNGQDAVVTLDGQELVRSSNTFTEGGVTYTLNKADPLVENTVTLTNDVDAIYNSISSFINKYNEVLDAITKKLLEKPNKDFPPLTDAQKDAMEQKDIEKWEEKAKIGLLRSDPTLRKIVDDMRMQLIQPVEGVHISLAGIGISSKSHLDYGKLTIDEKKLKEAIKNDPDSVMDLLSKQSATLSSYDRKATAEQRTARFKEEGIVNRLYDIIQDNISILMDSNKRKGTLLEKAGMTGDSTDLTSVLSKQIIDNEDMIFAWETKLSRREESYYRKFSAMETALSKLNSQSTWIAAQLASMSNY